MKTLSLSQWMAARRTTSKHQQALALAGIFAAVKLAIHLGSNFWQAHLGWGYWRDEFYYVACGHHLAWGYVDFGPLIAWMARLSDLLFGTSLAGLRLLAALAGAGRVLLTGLLAYRLGGSRIAQTLAMAAALAAPTYLGEDSVLNPSAFESIFWMGCALCLLMLQQRLGTATPLQLAADESGCSGANSACMVATARPQQAGLWGPWIGFGALAGLGLLNKPSMAFFLLALGIALVITRSGRALLLRREACAGAGLLLLIALPNLVWQWSHGWPMLTFLAVQKLRNGPFHVAEFLGAPVDALGPPAVALWGVGLVSLLWRARTRFLGGTYGLFLAIMMVLAAKAYYTYPIYPLLLAGGGVAWERVLARWPRVRTPAAASACVVLLGSGAVLLPTVIPVLSPEALLRYTAVLHLDDAPPATSKESPLPTFFADRFGWQEEADAVTRAVAGLSAADRAQAVILCDNYGEAGALQLLAPSLPPVISGQNTYFLWGYGGTSGAVVLAVSARPAAYFESFYRKVALVGDLNHSRYMTLAERQAKIYVLRDPRQSMAAWWPTLRQ